MSEISEISQRQCFQISEIAPANVSVFRPREIARRPRFPKLAQSRAEHVFRISEIVSRPIAPVSRPSEIAHQPRLPKLAKSRIGLVFRISEIVPGLWPRSPANRNRAPATIAKISEIAHRPCFPNKRNRFAANGPFSGQVKSRIGREVRN